MDITIGEERYHLKDGLYYSRSHNWVAINNNLATVGLSDYAQAKMGEISMVELMAESLPGTEVFQVQYQGLEPQSDPIPDVTIECAKSVSELYSPLTGIIDAVNGALLKAPGQVNFSPYEKGWLFTIRPSNLSAELCHLMDCASYTQFLKSL